MSHASYRSRRVDIVVRRLPRSPQQVPPLELTLATSTSAVSAMARPDPCPSRRRVPPRPCPGAGPTRIPRSRQCRRQTRLSLGFVDGRNIWVTDLDARLLAVEAAEKRSEQRRSVAPPVHSCTSRTTPTSRTTSIRAPKRGWRSATRSCLRSGPSPLPRELMRPRGESCSLRTLPCSRRDSEVIPTDPAVCSGSMRRRRGFRTPVAHIRSRKNAGQRLGLPVLPTTTIGSLPQTSEVRDVSVLQDGEVWTENTSRSFA